MNPQPNLVTSTPKDLDGWDNKNYDMEEKTQICDKCGNEYGIRCLKCYNCESEKTIPVNKPSTIISDLEALILDFDARIKKHDSNKTVCGFVTANAYNNAKILLSEIIQNHKQ